jgi:hypothetical protein
LTEVLNYPELNEEGKAKIQKILDFMKPLEEKDISSGFLAKARKEKPVRVDNRTR